MKYRIAIGKAFLQTRFLHQPKNAAAFLKKGSYVLSIQSSRQAADVFWLFICSYVYSFTAGKLTTISLSLVQYGGCN